MCLKFKNEGFEETYPCVNIALTMYLCSRIEIVLQSRSFSVVVYNLFGSTAPF